MIGKIIIGKSFRGCLGYCLEKWEAEILDYNLCYGNKKELQQQYNDVRKLNPKLSKPVMHVTLSLSPGEKVDRATLIKMAQACAKDLGFENNQYVLIEHRDTKHQHIHIVINRVGFDGKTVKDNHNYQKMAAYCRKMEEKYKLQKVLSPRRYQSREERQLPRADQRKEQLKRDIHECLAMAKNYQDFEQLMQLKKYSLQKARGIAFTDEKKVRTKGSDVGYPLSKIERILALPKEQKLAVLEKGKVTALTLFQEIKRQPAIIEKKQKDLSLFPVKEKSLLLKPESNAENINPALFKKKRQRKRRPRL
jgi:hypothetical protein